MKNKMSRVETEKLLIEALDMEHHKAIEVLVKADLRLGNTHERMLRELEDEERYEELATIKKVYDEMGIKLPKY